MKSFLKGLYWWCSDNARGSWCCGCGSCGRLTIGASGASPIGNHPGTVFQTFWSALLSFEIREFFLVKYRLSTLVQLSLLSKIHSLQNGMAPMFCCRIKWSQLSFVLWIIELTLLDWSVMLLLCCWRLGCLHVERHSLQQNWLDICGG